MEKYDVVITSYSLIARDFAEYQEHEFRYEFLDEAQYIKNSSTQTAKAVKSSFRLTLRRKAAGSRRNWKPLGNMIFRFLSIILG